MFQFLASLFTGQPNDRLAHFGRNLARYFQQITVYLTFTTEEKPFPFTPWPDEPQEETPVGEDRIQLNDKSGNTADTTEIDETGEANRTNDTEATDNEDDPDKSKD